MRRVQNSRIYNFRRLDPARLPRKPALLRQVVGKIHGFQSFTARAFEKAFPAGSYVAISHATPDEVPEVNDVERVFDEATTRAHVRSRTEIRKLVAGMDIIEPGLAWPPEWRPEPGEEIPANAAESYYCVVVARTT